MGRDGYMYSYPLILVDNYSCPCPFDGFSPYPLRVFFAGTH